MAKKDAVPATILKRIRGSQSPKFDLPISIRKLDGEEVQITLSCIAIRKTDWCKLRDERECDSLKAVIQDRAIEVAQSPADETVSAATENAPAPANQVDDVLSIVAQRGFEASTRAAMARDIKLIKSFAKGWELEDDFNADNLEALEEEFGGVLDTIISAYDGAVFRGRVGNFG
jgi:Phage tail assembly chaperone